MVGKDVAEKEVNEWLDHMDIPENARKVGAVKIFVDSIVESVSKGFLVINDDKTITQKLKTPLAEGATKEIIYDFRYTIGEYYERMKEVNETNETELAIAKLSFIAKKPKEFIGRLEGKDFKVARALVIFF